MLCAMTRRPFDRLADYLGMGELDDPDGNRSSFERIALPGADSSRGDLGLSVLLHLFVISVCLLNAYLGGGGFFRAFGLVAAAAFAALLVRVLLRFRS
jgi:hypothetical protein